MAIARLLLGSDAWFDNMDLVTKKGFLMKNWMFGLVLASILPACVTINIYFPAAAAEKAADKIIDEVWQIKNGEKPTVNAVEPVANPVPTPVK
jgi:hypothetical protein